MAGIFTTQSVSILPATQSSAGSISLQAAQIQAQSPQVEDSNAQTLFNLGAASLTSVQHQIDTIVSSLRNDLPFPETIAITDPTGNLIAWIGYQVVGNISYSGIWAKQAWFGGTGPANANITINGSAVVIQNATFIVNGPSGSITIQGSPGPELIAVSSSTTLTYSCSTSQLTMVSGNIELFIETQGAPQISLGNTLTGRAILLDQFAGEIILQSATSVSNVLLSDTGVMQLLGTAPSITLAGTSGPTLVIATGSSNAATSGSETLPANPAGFFVWQYAGITAKVPFYNN